MQVARDDRFGAEDSIRWSLQVGEAARDQVPRRVRGPEADDGGVSAQALQEAAEARSTRHHIRHVPDGSSEMCRVQRDVGHPSRRLPGFPQSHGRLGRRGAREPAGADQCQSLANDVQAQKSEGRAGDKGETSDCVCSLCIVCEAKVSKDSVEIFNNLELSSSLKDAISVPLQLACRMLLMIVFAPLRCDLQQLRS